MNIDHVYKSIDNNNKPVNIIMPQKMREDIDLLNKKFPRKYKKSKNRSEFIRGSLFLTSSLHDIIPFEEYSHIEDYTNDLIELIKLGQEAKQAR